MRIRPLVAVLLLAGIVPLGCEDDDDPAGPATSFAAVMTGASESPPVTTSATGTATFQVDGASIDYTLTTTGLTNVTAAHIHGPAQPGENAGIIVGLFIQQTEGDWPGNKTATFDVADFTQGQSVTTMAALLDLMRTGGAYVNFHTTENPAGAIRGQILPN